MSAASLAPHGNEATAQSFGPAAAPGRETPREPIGATCPPLDLPVDRIGPPPSAYREFCIANPGHCTLHGPAAIPWTSAAQALVAGVNRDVNGAVRFTPDIETTGEEESWQYPVNGRGDCEDVALEKRRRLVAQGLPAAALTMAIVVHRVRLVTHAVLMAETDAGTFVLDSLDTRATCWDRLPYNFETRERPDGLWLRYDQDVWTFEDAPTGHLEDCSRAAR